MRNIWCGDILFTIKIGSKLISKSKVELFLSYLLAPLSFIGLPYCDLVFKVLALYLTINLSISDAKSIGGEVTIAFSRQFL